MKNILSVTLLLVISGCGFNLVDESETAQKLSSITDIELVKEGRLTQIGGRLIPQECERTNSCLPHLERIDDIKLRNELRQIDAVLRPEFMKKKIIICHKGKTKKIKYRDWPRHRDHGDTRGACP